MLFEMFGEALAEILEEVGGVLVAPYFFYHIAYFFVIPLFQVIVCYLPSSFT